MYGRHTIRPILAGKVPV